MSLKSHLLLFGASLAGLTTAVHGTLLLSESFDYGAQDNSTKFLRGDNDHDGGSGWFGEWKAVSGDPDGTGGIRLDLSETSIAFPGTSNLASVGGQIKNNGGGGQSQREMSEPLEMNGLGDLYFSALVNWSSGAAFRAEFLQTLPLAVRWTPFNIDSSGQVRTGVTNLSASSVALSDGVDYVIVGKLERNGGAVSDIASLSVFPVSNPGDFLTEPASWDVVHSTDASGVVLNALRVSASNANDSVIDEIRLGDSYADVVGELGIKPGIIYESFNYGGGVNLTTETTNSGAGWVTAWATTGPSGLVTSGTGQSLWFGQSPSTITDGSTHVWSESSRANARDFTTALPVSGSLYFTALVRAYGGGAGVAQMRAEFHDGPGASGNMRANVGIDRGTLFADGDSPGYGQGTTLASAFAVDTTYLLAMKRSGTSIFAALIPADGNPATLAAEPAWQVQNDTLTGVTFRSIRLLTNSTDANMGAGIRIDEVRVANSWSGVVHGMIFEGPDTGGSGLAITSAGFNLSDAFEVTAEGLTPGITYFLWRDSDLSGSFIDKRDEIVAGSSTETLKDDTPLAGKAFYRVSE